MYIEYYIIENLLINYIIIICTSILIKRHTNEKKKWIGAFLGTIYSVAYLYPTLGVLFTLPFKLIIMTFIILTSFTYKDKKLTFVIKATQVEVEGEPLENFSVTTFSFDMVKK